MMTEAERREYNRVWWHSRKARIDRLKSEPCADCGGSFPPECMDFDHVRGQKAFNLSAARNRKIEVILSEIEKCDLVCSNCHRIRTKQRNAPMV